jgi:hypothetical protein
LIRWPAVWIASLVSALLGIVVGTSPDSLFQRSMTIEDYLGTIGQKARAGT